MLQTLVFGLLLGGVYALMASGLSLLFGVMHVVNLAHGAFIFLGAYIAWGANELFGLDPLLSPLVTMPLMFALGAAMYRLLFPRLERSERFIEATVLLTFGLALITEGMLTWVFTGVYRSTDPSYGTEAFTVGSVLIPKGQLYAAVVSVGLLAALWGFLYLTRTGHGIRATMQNRMAAQIVGVNVRRMSTISFGIGMALAGAAGSLMSYLFAFFPAGHWSWLAILLSLVVLGGFGSLLGAFVGALVLAVASAFVSDVFGPTWSPMTFYLALFLILLVRPHGLFGEPVEA